MTIRHFLLALAALCVMSASPAAAQSMDPAKWVLIEADNVFMDTSTVAPANSGGQRVWIRAVFEGELDWPRHPEVKYNAIYYERVYRCDAFQWVTLRHQAYLNDRMVRDMPNIFAGIMNDGRNNQAEAFAAVCERISATKPHDAAAGVLPSRPAPQPVHHSRPRPLPLLRLHAAGRGGPRDVRVLRGPGSAPAPHDGAGELTGIGQ